MKIGLLITKAELRLLINLLDNKCYTKLSKNDKITYSKLYYNLDKLRKIYNQLED